MGLEGDGGGGASGALEGSGEITRLLAAARTGDRHSLDQVYELVYGELKRLAARQRGSFGPGGGADTLSTIALVHEAYLKLAGGRIWAGADRAHFFALAARAMRQILLDHARGQGRQKRGAGALHVDLTTRPRTPLKRACRLVTSPCSPP